MESPIWIGTGRPTTWPFEKAPASRKRFERGTKRELGGPTERGLVFPFQTERGLVFPSRKRSSSRKAFEKGTKRPTSWKRGIANPSQKESPFQKR